MADHINVSPSRLRETAGTFHKASLDTYTLLDSLKGTAQGLINDMYSELRHSPTALERLCAHWYNSTENLGNALQEVANNLQIAADNFENADRTGMPKS